MRAMILEAVGQPLQCRSIARPTPGPGQVLVKVAACGVCRTDLHVVDGDLTQPRLPIIPGHEIVGHIEAIGAGVEEFTLGDRVGIPWLGHTCGNCAFCRSEQENLCDAPLFTGYQIDGGYAEFTVAAPHSEPTDFNPAGDGPSVRSRRPAGIRQRNRARGTSAASSYCPQAPNRKAIAASRPWRR